MKVLNEIENLDEYDSFKCEAQNQQEEPQCPGDVRGCVYPVFFIGLTAYVIEQKGVSVAGIKILLYFALQ